MESPHNDIVVISWDGVSQPLNYISFDVLPAFNIMVFDYSGNNNPIILPNHIPLFGCIRKKTEFKGALIHTLCEDLIHTNYNYIGILDDDQEVSISTLNYILSLAANNGIHAFQPSIAHNSFYSHHQFLNDPSKTIEKVNWIEIMCPFFTKELFEAGKEFYRGNISSYGLDKYLYPYLIKKYALNGPYLIHGNPVRHNRKVTQGNRVFSNNLDARQEAEVIRKKILRRIRDERIMFSPMEMKDIYEVGVFRWQKIKYDIKRLIKF